MKTFVMGRDHNNQIKLFDHNDILPAAASGRFAQVAFITCGQIGLPPEITVTGIRDIITVQEVFIVAVADNFTGRSCNKRCWYGNAP